MATEHKVRARLWKAGEPQDGFEFAKISDYLVADDTLVWVDICEPDHALLADLATELGLNTWAIEDAVADSERVKATVYRSHLFFTVYAVDIACDEDQVGSQPLLSKHRISAFVLPRGLITVRLSPDFDIEQVSDRWDEIGLVRYGVGALVHGLLDVVVDGQFDVVQALDDGIEGLEDELFDGPSRNSSLTRRNFQLRKDLVQFRRAVLPMREVINTIQHHRIDIKSAPELDPLYVDLYDHVLRVSEWTESLRDMITSVFETNLSLQDARLNTIMKKLTGWAAIIAVPTAITGFYGQNVPYPGNGAWWGFLASSASILILVAVLYVAFKRRDWL